MLTSPSCAPISSGRASRASPTSSLPPPTIRSSSCTADGRTSLPTVNGDFSGDRFLVKQLVRPLVNLYEVYASPDGQAAGDLVAHVRQKRAALKEDIRAFADSTEEREVFRIKARAVLELGGRYDVTAGADGARLGTLEKLFGKSLLRSSWRVLDPQEVELMTATESSAAVAIGRRIKDFLPLGDLVPLPYHFTFEHDGAPVGELRRIYGLRDQYSLDLGSDAERRIDRRLAVALAVALDALQAR